MEHTADLGAWFYGRDPEAVFVNAGLALMTLMIERPPRRGEAVTAVALEASDPEDLLVRWLNELLYLVQVKRRVAVSIRATGLTRTRFEADVETAGFDLARHGIRGEIKAATYHALELRPWRGRWRARVVFDL